MPRLPRSWTLQEGASLHKVWRGHNKEFNLGTPEDKLRYLNYLQEEKAKDPNPLHAFCIMGNHSHEVYTLKDLPKFSNYMRQHHARYGLVFNKRHKRCGKVAQDRPLTSQFENDQHEMRAVLYIHANPIRAGIKHGRNYLWSTHQLYAYGKRPKWLKEETIQFPGWYMALGKTMEERQKVYRDIFERYLIDYGYKKEPIVVYGTGSIYWVMARHKSISERFKQYKSSD